MQDKLVYFLVSRVENYAGYKVEACFETFNPNIPFASKAYGWLLYGPVFPRGRKKGDLISFGGVENEYT